MKGPIYKHVHSYSLLPPVLGTCYDIKNLIYNIDGMFLFY